MTEPETWLVPREQEGNIDAIAQHIKEVAKLKARREIEAGVSGVQDTPWFIEKHLDVVENRVDWILGNCDGAKSVDRNEALIAVWTHDFGRLMGWDYAHHAASAFKAKKWLLDNGLSKDVADRIFNAALKHRAADGQQPETPLEKVIASADALSHFDGCETGTIEGFLEKKGFWYLRWKERIEKGFSDGEVLEGSFKKIERDVTSKQGFRESKERAGKEYEFLRNNASEILQNIRTSLAP